MSNFPYKLPIHKQETGLVYWILDARDEVILDFLDKKKAAFLVWAINKHYKKKERCQKLHH